MEINITFPVPPPPPASKVIFTLRKYGDSFMVEKMGLSTVILQTGNFQNIDLFTLQNADDTYGGFGAVSNFQRIDAAGIAYLKSIQPVDSVELKRKMNWLGIVDNPTPDMPNTYGRPYMLKRGVNTWGTMIFGGQRVQVEAVNGVPVVYTFNAKYQSEGTADIRPLKFYKVIGLRRSDMGRPLVELLAEGLVQKCTEAYFPSDQYNDSPQGGTIYNPVWSPLDWPTNYGKSAVYVARAFLEGLT